MEDLVTKKSNEIIDPQAQMIVEFLKDIGLPHEKIIAAQSERRLIGDNLNSHIGAIPPEIRKDARCFSKFVVGAGCGLFDYPLNTVWNEVVLNLQKKAIFYGLDIFYDAAVGGSKTREFISEACFGFGLETNGKPSIFRCENVPLRYVTNSFNPATGEGSDLYRLR